MSFMTTILILCLPLANFSTKNLTFYSLISTVSISSCNLLTDKAFKEVTPISRLPPSFVNREAHEINNLNLDYNGRVLTLCPR